MQGPERNPQIEQTVIAHGHEESRPDLAASAMAGARQAPCGARMDLESMRVFMECPNYVRAKPGLPEGATILASHAKVDVKVALLEDGAEALFIDGERINLDPEKDRPAMSLYRTLDHCTSERELLDHVDAFRSLNLATRAPEVAAPEPIVPYVPPTGQGQTLSALQMAAMLQDVTRYKDDPTIQQMARQCHLALPEAERISLAAQERDIFESAVRKVARDTMSMYVSQTDMAADFKKVACEAVREVERLRARTLPPPTITNENQLIDYLEDLGFSHSKAEDEPGLLPLGLPDGHQVYVTNSFERSGLPHPYYGTSAALFAPEPEPNGSPVLLKLLDSSQERHPDTPEGVHVQLGLSPQEIAAGVAQWVRDGHQK